MARPLITLRRHRVAIFSSAVIAAFAVVLWAARGALPAFFIGVALAFALDPAVTRLHKLGVERWTGILLSYAGVAIAVWLVFAFAVPPISRQTAQFIQQLPTLGATVQGLQDSVQSWYRSLPLSADMRSIVDQQIVSSQQAIGATVRDLLAPTLAAILRFATFLFGLLIVPVWLFFVLKDREHLYGAVVRSLPPHWRTDVENLLQLLGRVGGRWVRGQLILGASIFVATAIGLTALAMIGFREFGEYTLVLALIAGFLEWVPIIGPIVAAVPAILVGGSISWPAAAAAALLYLIIQQLENNILVPKVLGDAIRLHPAVLIISLVVGGALFGIGGAVLAVPLVAAGRDLYRYGFHRLSGLEPEPAFQLTLDVSSSKGDPRAGQTNAPAESLPEPSVL